MNVLRSALVGAGSFVLAAACSGNAAGDSCGAYLGKLVAFDEYCSGRAGGLYAASRDEVVAFCDELSSAPGVSNFSAQVDACTQNLDPATCTEPSCPVRGTETAGAACVNGAQCQSGYCVFMGATDPTTELECGTCNALATQDSDCSNAACDTGLYCDATTKKCVAFVPLNGSCGGNVDACDPQYACIKSVCSERVAAGGGCPAGVECKLSLTCSPQTHTCVATPIVSAGEACGFLAGEEVYCSSGLICADGVCAAPKQQGAPCTVGNHECAYNLVCTGGTCQVIDFGACK